MLSVKLRHFYEVEIPSPSIITLFLHPSRLICLTGPDSSQQDDDHGNLTVEEGAARMLTLKDFCQVYSQMEWLRQAVMQLAQKKGKQAIRSQQN